MSAKEFIDYDGVIGAESDQAIMLQSESGGEEIWLPKACVGKITYVDRGDKILVFIGELIEAIEMERWLAIDRGLL